MWYLDELVIGPQEAFLSALRHIANPLRAPVPEGTYLRLYEADKPAGAVHDARDKVRLWMSDTPQEQADHADLYDNAPHEGTLLIAGMGVCMSLKHLLKTRPNLRIIQVEREAEVIRLNREHPENGKALTDPRVTVVCEDIFSYVKNPDPSITAAWFDIWPDIYAGNLKEMDFLESQFPDLDFCKSWARAECEEIEKWTF